MKSLSSPRPSTPLLSSLPSSQMATDLRERGQSSPGTDKIIGRVYVDKPILRGQFHKFGALLYPPFFGLPLYFRARSLSNETMFATVLFSLAVESILVISATLHTYPWQTERAYLIARKLDFVAIFVGISLLYSSMGKLLLGHHRYYIYIELLVWVCAMVGATTKCFFPDAPPWLNASMFLTQGWACAPLIPALFRTATLPEAMGLFVGGVFVTLGALAYSLQWPRNRRCRPQREIVFGPHEMFHVGTLLMFASFWYTMWMRVVRVGVVGG